MTDVAPSAGPERHAGWRAPVNRVDHTTLRVHDVGEVGGWYERVLDFRVIERTADRAVLTCGLDGRVDLVLTRGGTGISACALGIDSVEALDALADELADRGTSVERVDLGLPGIDGAIQLSPPSGVAVQVVASASAPTGVCAGARPAGVAPIDTDHATLVVPDVRGYSTWLTDTLGFAVSDAVSMPEDAEAWLSAWTHITPQHHDVALIAGAPPATLHHIAFLAADLNHMGEVCNRVCSFGAQRAEWGIGKHGGLGANNFLYIKDPAGNRVEVNSNMATNPFEDDTVIYPAAEFASFISVWDFNPPPDTFLAGS